MRRIFGALLALALLSACDSTESLVALKHATPAADPYQAALATDYQDFAEEKRANYQWWTSKYFADKGLLAAYGKDVPPEDPAHWDGIAAPQRAEFTQARDQLLTALIGGKSAQPVTAAHATVAYDRWIVLADNGWDTAHIDEARDRFFTLLGKIQQPGEEGVSVKPTVTETTSTLLYFPFDSARLSGSAGLALQQLVEYVKSAGNVSIVINGHADRAGSDEYNMTLSENRAKFVRAALLAAGVPENLIEYFAFGETDPDIATADGVAEPLNRRVEIFIE